MKMGNRRLKRLDSLGVRVLSKPRITDSPTNRAERRAAKAFIRRSKKEVKMHTKDYLAQELKIAGLDEMAAKAATGYYHDFLSPLALPEIQLMVDLEAVGTPEAQILADRHANGEFDASMEESNEWYRSAEGQECITAFKDSIGPSKPKF